MKFRFVVSRRGGEQGSRVVTFVDAVAWPGGSALVWQQNLPLHGHSWLLHPVCPMSARGHPRTSTSGGLNHLPWLPPTLWEWRWGKPGHASPTAGMCSVEINSREGWNNFIKSCKYLELNMISCYRYGSWLPINFVLLINQ